MTDHELEQRIRTALEHAAPDRLDQILSSCGQQTVVDGTPAGQARPGDQAEGVIIDMSEGKKQTSRSGSGRKRFAAIAAVAAMFVLCIGGFSLFRSGTTPVADSVIMLDVNPSLSLTVDAGEKVLSVEALNEDAEEVLGSMELENTSLEVAVNAIIGSMLQKGYLGDLQNAILVSVEDADAARGEALQQKVSAVITNAAQNSALDAAVLSQVVNAGDEALAELAAQYGISLGKAALIQEVITQVPTLSFQDLAPMTINEIALIAASKNVSSASVTQSGAASNKAYLSQADALKAACDHAGVAVEDVIQMEVEFDSKNGTMIYEVEFATAAKKGEYEIDAVTGEILKAELKARNGAEEASGCIGAAAAKEAALSHAGVAAEDLLEIEIELDSDNHARIYKVEFETSTNKYEYKIDAVTGEVVTFETKEQKNLTSGNSGSGTSAGCIGEAAAKQAALSHAQVSESSADYVKCYLEYRDGKPVCYCVELKVGKTEYEYKIDLYSAAVLEDSAENPENSSDSGGISYIGDSAALAAALNHAGVTEASLREKHVELERDGSTMIYKVEFETSHDEYEYKIDAVTGAVLSTGHH